MYKKPKLTIKSTSTPAMLKPFFNIEDVWIGIGWLGHWKQGSYRRFLRHRDKYGVVKYFTWANWSNVKRDKGNHFINVRGFRKVKKVTNQQIEKQYEIH